MVQRGPKICVEVPNGFLTLDFIRLFHVSYKMYLFELLVNINRKSFDLIS